MSPDVFRSTLFCFVVSAIPSCFSHEALGATAVPTYDAIIRPLMRKHCQTCHNPQRMEAGLDLSTYEAIQEGSDLGSVVSPGDAKDSLLYLVVAHLEEPAMPPGREPLSDEIQQQIASWIDEGMPRSAIGAVSPSPAMSVADNSSKQEEPKAFDQGLVFRPKRGNPITAVAVSPNGLVAWSGQRQIILQEIETGSLIHVLAYPEGECFDLDFVDQGRKLLAAGGMHAESGHVTIWDVESGARLAMHGNEIDVLLAAATSPDGTRIVGGGPEAVLRVGDATTGQTVWKSNRHTDWILDVAIDPDGLMLASADRGGNVFVWELENGERMHVLNGHSGAVPQLAFSESGDRLITVCADGRVRSWDMHRGDLLDSWEVDSEGLLGVAVNLADQITTVGRTSGVRTWDAAGRETMRQDLEGRVCCELSASMDFAAVGTFDGRVFACKINSGQPWKELDLAREQVTENLSRIVTVPRRSARFVDHRSAADQFLSVGLDESNLARAKEQDGDEAKGTQDFSWLAKRLEEERNRYAAIRDELEDLEGERRTANQRSIDMESDSLRELIDHLTEFRKQSVGERSGLAAELETNGQIDIGQGEGSIIFDEASHP